MIFEIQQVVSVPWLEAVMWSQSVFGWLRAFDISAAPTLGSNFLYVIQPQKLGLGLYNFKQESRLRNTDYNTATNRVRLRNVVFQSLYKYEAVTAQPRYLQRIYGGNSFKLSAKKHKANRSQGLDREREKEREVNKLCSEVFLVHSTVQGNRRGTEPRD